MDGAWNDVRLFLAVAERGSLSAAARELRLGQPTVSRRLAELEDTLGYPLFRRRASGAVLTPQGEKLLTPARKMAEWAGEIARASVSAKEAGPQGVVRIAAAPGVAYEFVAPFAAWLTRKTPAVTIEVLSSIHYLDLARGEADLALRMRAPSSKDLTVLATLEHRNRAFAAKAYARTLPRRYGFADVKWVAWAPPHQDLPPNPQLEAIIPNFRPVFTTDNFLVMLKAVECGLGAMILGDVPHRFSKDVGLVPLDLDLGRHARSALHLVCAKSALDISRVRFVADALSEELQRIARKQP